MDSMEALKAEYRKLALENHPDKGGDVKIMQEINAEFETMFSILKSKYPDSGVAGETATSYRREFYTENGWAGSRYDSILPLKEIAKIVRGYVKDVYPTWKFSITTHYASMCQELSVSMMEGPVDIFDKEKIREAARKEAWRWPDQRTEDEIYKHMITRAYTDHIQNWEHHEWFTDTAQKVLDDVYNLVQSYNRSDCDASIDYFNVNFYTSFDIGKWNKPFRVVERTARIAASRGNPETRRIAG
jgi:curved DNA-binding protein CbpA